jgi:aldehyde:ferredoxin oxidoreductase
MAAREWMIANHGYHVDRPRRIGSRGSNSSLEPGRSAYKKIEPSRTAGCQSCFAPCRRQFESGSPNDSQCVETTWYRTPNMLPSDVYACIDLAQQYGVNAHDTGYVLTYLTSLHKRGLAGPGRRIDATGYDFDRSGTVEHCRAMLDLMAARKGIGADLAEGLVRAAKKWGTLDADLADGTLPYPQWGYREHHSASVEYFFGSLFADRDVNEHDYLSAFQIAGGEADQPAFHTIVPPEKLASMLSEVTIPYTGDPFMFDFNYDLDAPHGVYSKSKAKYVAWQRHYSRFWKQSILYCDWLFSNLLNSQNEDYRGFTPEAEPKFFNAVTGSRMTFADGMETGRKIWNMDRALWVLQGRTRNMEKFAPYVYKRPMSPDRVAVPVYNKDGTWSYGTQQDKQYNEAGVERMKTHFYELEGWDVENGWPTRATLEQMQLGRVADVLASKNRLGK